MSLSFLVVLTTIFNSNGSAETSDNQLSQDDLEKINLNDVTNLDSTLSNLGLSKDTLLDNNNRVKGEKSGFINAKDKNGVYYNFYLNENTIEYYSIQTKKDNGNATFELYDLNKNRLLNSEVKKNGELIKEQTEDQSTNGVTREAGINKAAFKWACIFSSYVACVGVAGAAGAGGALVSGPFGAAAGFAGGAACRYIFQTAVDKYGSKEKACSVLG